MNLKAKWVGADNQANGQCIIVTYKFAGEGGSAVLPYV